MDEMGPVSLICPAEGVRKLKELQSGRQVTGKHQRDWDQLAMHIGKRVTVHWVKANFKADEAAFRAAGGGYPAVWHGINSGANALATRGAAQHIDDFGAGELRERAVQRVQRHWKYLRWGRQHVPRLRGRGQHPKSIRRRMTGSPPKPGASTEMCCRRTRTSNYPQASADWCR